MKTIFKYIFLLAFFSPCVNADIYKCIKNNNEIEFTSMPCMTGAKEVKNDAATEQVFYANLLELFEKYSCNTLAEFSNKLPSKEEVENLSIEYFGSTNKYDLLLKEYRNMDNNSKKYDEYVAASGSACAISFVNGNLLSISFYSNNSANNKTIKKFDIVNKFIIKGYPTEKNNLDLVEKMGISFENKWVSPQGFKCMYYYNNVIDEVTVDINCML